MDMRVRYISLLPLLVVMATAMCFMNEVNATNFDNTITTANLKTPKIHDHVEKQVEAPFSIQQLGQNVTDVLPYLVRKSAREGLMLRFPHSQQEYKVQHGAFFHYDFAISTLEESIGLETVSRDSLTETVEWKYSSAHPQASMVTPLVLSSPYITVAFHQVTPLISTQHEIVEMRARMQSDRKDLGDISGDEVVSLRNQTVVTGRRFTLLLSDSSSWVLYSSIPISLRLYCDSSARGTHKCSQLTSESRISSGGLRIAMISAGDNGTKALKKMKKHESTTDVKLKRHNKYLNELILDKFASDTPLGAYPHVDDKNEQIHVQWLTTKDDNKGDGNELLMVALQREVDHLVNALDAGVMYETPRGVLYGVVATEWQLA